MASQIAKNKLWELTKANFTYTTLNYTLDYHEKFSYSNLFTKEKQILSLNFSITVSLSTRSPFANETHAARARDNEHPHKGCLHTMFHFPKWSHFLWTASEICNLPHFVLGYSCFSLLHFFFKKWFVFIFGYDEGQIDLEVLQIADVSGIQTLFETEMLAGNHFTTSAVESTASTAAISWRKIKICSSQMCITFCDTLLKNHPFPHLVFSISCALAQNIKSLSSRHENDNTIRSLLLSEAIYRGDFDCQFGQASNLPQVWCSWLTGAGMTEWKSLPPEK